MSAKPENQSNAPLAGVRVLELARILAGPWAGQVLADLGADVVKVERAGQGDDTRQWGPPFATGADEHPHNSAYFNSCNRGKRSITADFDNPEGIALIHRLVAQADVLIENFKVGGLLKYGLDCASLQAINPRLVYCSITGFGQNGPYASRPGYDFIVQGMSGLMDATGEPDGQPMKAGNAPADLFAGLYGVVGILAALHRRDRTGAGAWLDIALLDVQVAALPALTSNYMTTGEIPRRMGNAHPNIVPYEVFPVADGYLIVTAGNNRQFIGFCTVLGIAEVALDERFISNATRLANRTALIALLAAQTIRFDRDALLARLEAVGVPAGPINTIAQVLADPQIGARQMRLDLEDASVHNGVVPGIRTPIVLDGAPCASSRPPPRLGADADEVLQDPLWGGRSAPQ